MRKSCLYFAFSAWIALGLTGGAFAAGANADSTLLQKYVAIQEALARDSTDGVPALAAEISKLAQTQGIKVAAEKMAAGGTIAVQRKQFKDLSSAIVPLAKSEATGLEIYSCSMAKAKWVQRKGTPHNPYYGKAMEECGDRVDK